MSKVKIQGNASGTGVVTLTAPNTNTDRTITLPDGDISFGVGIDDNATSTAITIDASENVGIGTTNPAVPLDVRGGASSNWAAILESTNATGWGTKILGGADGGDYSLLVKNYADTSLFEVRADGRGLSQFTAKAWMNIKQTGTQTIRDSHNCSSITDMEVGGSKVFFTNNLSSATFCSIAGGQWGDIRAGSYHDYRGVDHTRFYCVSAGGQTQADATSVDVIVFGD
jgi:hypothetical protein